MCIYIFNDDNKFYFVFITIIFIIVKLAVMHYSYLRAVEEEETGGTSSAITV